MSERKDEKSRWYADPTKWIAFAAFALSIWSAWQTHQKDVDTRRSELRQLIEQFPTAPGDVRTNVIRVRRAADLIDKIPDATLVECVAVANAAWNLGLPPAKILHLYDLAEKRADNPYDQIYVHTSRGGYLFVTDPAAGRAEFQRAVDIAKADTTSPEPQRKWGVATNYIYWAQVELAAQHCAEARERLSDAFQLGFGDTKLQADIDQCGTTHAQ